MSEGAKRQAEEPLDSAKFEEEVANLEKDIDKLPSGKPSAAIRDRMNHVIGVFNKHNGQLSSAIKKKIKLTRHKYLQLSNRASAPAAHPAPAAPPQQPTDAKDAKHHPSGSHLGSDEETFENTLQKLKHLQKELEALIQSKPEAKAPMMVMEAALASFPRGMLQKSFDNEELTTFRQGLQQALEACLVATEKISILERSQPFPDRDSLLKEYRKQRQFLRQHAWDLHRLLHSFDPKPYTTSTSEILGMFFRVQTNSKVTVDMLEPKSLTIRKDHAYSPVFFSAGLQAKPAAEKMKHLWDASVEIRQALSEQRQQKSYEEGTLSEMQKLIIQYRKNAKELMSQLQEGDPLRDDCEGLITEFTVLNFLADGVRLLCKQNESSLGANPS